MAEEINQHNQTENISEPAAASQPPLDSDPAPASVPDSASEILSQSGVQSGAKPEPQPEVKSETQPELPISPQPQVEASSFQQTSAQTSSRMRELWGKFREKVIERKSKKLEKIMALANKKRRITNDDTQKLLNISDATATRYLKELVRQGRLKQSGVKSVTIYEFLN